MGARQLGLPDAVDNLDGTLGLDEVQLPVLLIGLGIQALAASHLQRQEDDGNILSVEYNAGRCPGDLGFDPLNFLQGSGSTKKDLHNIEVNLGRLAMIGATSFLLRWQSCAAGGMRYDKSRPMPFSCIVSCVAQRLG